jgi:hypothetical protein
LGLSTLDSDDSVHFHSGHCEFTVGTVNSQSIASLGLVIAGHSSAATAIVHHPQLFSLSGCASSSDWNCLLGSTAPLGCGAVLVAPLERPDWVATSACGARGTLLPTLAGLAAAHPGPLFRSKPFRAERHATTDEAPLGRACTLAEPASVTVKMRRSFSY